MSSKTNFWSPPTGTKEPPGAIVALLTMYNVFAAVELNTVTLAEIGVVIRLAIVMPITVADVAAGTVYTSTVEVPTEPAK
jgi:hypothetical protein